MRLEAALEGNLDEYLQAEMEAAQSAITNAVKMAVAGLTSEVKNQITNAGLGDGLARAVKNRIYLPKKGTLNAAGIVYSTVKYMPVFEQGAVISIKNAKWLAIPGPGAGRSGNKRLRTKDIEKLNLKLTFVQTKKPGLAMLIYRKGKESIVYFWLVKQVTIRKRIDFYAAASKWGDTIPDNIVTEWEKQKATTGLSFD